MKTVITAVTLALLVMHAGGEAEASYGFGATYLYGSVSGHQSVNTGSGPGGGDYLTIVRPDRPGFVDAFRFPSTIGDALLSVTHNGNLAYLRPDGTGELWQVTVNGVTAGTLSNSAYDWDANAPVTDWITDTFVIDGAAIAAINSNNLVALVEFGDLLSRSSRSDFRLNSLTIEANPVATPLPATVFLIAPGLALLAAVRRKTILS